MLKALGVLATSPDLPLGVPVQLQQSVLHHHENLVRLVGSLRSAGLGEGMIDASVRELVESYRGELTAAVRVLVRGDDA